MAYMTSVDEAISQIPLEKYFVELPLIPKPKKMEDSSLSQTASVPEKRILYFCNHNPDVLGRMLSSCTGLRDMILDLPGIKRMLIERKTMPADESTDDPKQKAILDFDPEQPDLAISLISCGQLIELGEYQKNPDPTPPACLFMMEFGEDDSADCADLIKWFLEEESLKDSILLIGSPKQAIPDGFEDQIQLIAMPQLDLEGIIQMILRTADSCTEAQRGQVAIIAEDYLGLSDQQVESILSLIMQDYGVPCEAFIPETDSPGAREACRRDTQNLIAREKAWMPDVDKTIRQIPLRETAVNPVPDSQAPKQDAAPAQAESAPFVTQLAYVPKDRILYFYSSNPDILEHVLNEGNRLWDLIRDLPAMQAMMHRQKNLRQDMSLVTPDDKAILGFDPKAADRMTALRECGQLVPLAEYKKTPTTPVPACLYMTDYATSATKSINENIDSEANLVKWFLDHPALQDSVLLIASPYKAVPDGFEDRIRLITVPQLDLEDITGLILQTQAVYDEAQREQVAGIARQYLGLSRKQVETILYQLEINLGVTCEAFVLKSDPPNLKEDCRAETLRLISEEKKRMLEKHPAFVYLDTKDSVKAVGMGKYEEWLELNSDSFLHSHSDAPRGIVFVGPPGTGKSLMACRTAQEFDCPAIEFSLTMVKGSLYGESSKNLEKYLKLLEDAAPVVVLVDEAEKHLSYGSDTHEVTSSLIGMLLSWMQKRKKSVFMFFTSNDISRMPPELRRPGRVDAIYFSGMPFCEELSCILQANLIRADEKAKQDGRNGLLAADLIESFKKHMDDGTAHSDCRKIIEGFAALARDTNRDILLTGADLEQIIRDVRKKLYAKKKKELRKNGKDERSAMPFTLEEFRNAMYDHIRNSFRATGERAQDMDAVIHLYHLSQKNSYLPVSSHDELENILREKKTVLPNLSFESDYDRLLYACIGEKLVELNKKKTNK